VKSFAAQTRESEIGPPASGRSRPQEAGYILLTLLLVVSLMVITAAVALPTITFEIRRDQEQELIHRGVQYTRAIRAYYKKFGRYPTRLEDLENTNNLRFLRKRYKDPVTRQDFRLLHFGEPGVKLTLSGGFGTTNIPGANPVGSPGMNGAGSSSSGFGNSGLVASGLGSSGVNSSGVFSQSSGPGGTSNGGFGASSNSQTPSGQQGTTASGTDSSSQVVSQTSSQTGGTGQGDTSSSSQQIVVGGPIVGVASISKKGTIREFNHKKNYNEWQFVYDPAADRGGLITTPTQPALQGFGSQPGQNLLPGSSSGNSSTPFPGLGNNPNPGGSTPPVQPPANPPQQQ
jgi:type II secretory pathway pseudopilin PulG